MTAFLWTVVILMAAALLAEILAFVGMALVARRAARRAQAIKGEVAQRLEPSVRLIKELKLSLQPKAETMRRDSQEIGSLVATRFRAVQAACLDTSRRADLIRLRLTEGVRTVEQQRQGQRVAYRDFVEPIQAASRVFRGLKFALWLLRKVA
jgi:hypothetical protein